MRKRRSPWAFLFLGIFCAGAPEPNLAQPPKPSVVETWEPSPKIAAQLGSAAFDLMDPVTTIAWSPDGRFLASATESLTLSGNVRIDLWNARTGERVWRTESKAQTVPMLRFSSDGRTLIETGGTASAMDVATGKRVPLPMPTEEAVSAKLSGDKRKILLSHPQARKPDLTIACPKEKDVFLSFRFSPDRKFLATGTRAGNLTLWDAEDGRRIRDFDLRIGQISSIEFTPDGKLLIAAGSGQSLYVFYTETGRQRFRFDDSWRQTRLAVHPQGKFLASAEPRGGTVCLWNLENGRREHIIQRALGNVNALAFSPDGTRIALAGQAGVRSASLGVWNVATGKPTIPISGHARPVGRLVFSPDGRFLATFAFDGSVCLWNAEIGELVSQLEGDAGSDLRFSPDGWLLGAADAVGNYRIWEASTGDLLVKGDRNPNQGKSRMSRFSPELDLLALAAPQGEVHLIETSTGQTLPALAVFDRHEVNALAFSSDGRTLAVGSGRPRVSNAPRGRVAIWDVRKRERLRDLRSPAPADGRSDDLRFEDLTFSPDGGTLAARHSGQQVEFWQPTLGVRLHEASIPRGKPMAFSPVGQVLLLLGDPADGDPGPAGSRIDLMESATGGIFRSWDIPRQVSAFALSPDGRHLALALKDSRQALLLEIEAPSANEPPEVPALVDAVENLAEEDAKTGRQAMAVLLAAGERSVGLLSSHLQPEGKLEGFDRKVERLIRELDDDNFFVRENASNELAALGPDAVPALKSALESKPPLEVDLRIRRVLKSSTSSAKKLKGRSLRRIRAIEILERIGTAEAKALLTSLAKTTPSPREASAIRLALQRIRQSSPDR